MASATETRRRRRPPAARQARGPRPARSARARRCSAGRGLPRRPGDHRGAARPGSRRPTLLRDHPELDYKLFLDLCGVDYLDATRDDRYEVVLHAYSVSKKHHVRLKTPLPERDADAAPRSSASTRAPTGSSARPGTSTASSSTGHPNLTRILTHDAFVGHPMRKDYPTAQRHVLKTPKEWLLDVPRGLRAHGGEHRPLAPGDARHLPRAGADGRRDDRGLRGRDRLHAPELREDGGGPDLLADHPLHRPAELLLVVHERPRLGAGRREAAGRSRRRRAPRPSA